MCLAAAVAIPLAIGTASSVGMGVYNSYAQASQAQASLNMAAQQQQAQISIGNQQGGRGIGTLHFIENVSHITFHGAFLNAAGQTPIWTFPNDASINI